MKEASANRRKAAKKAVKTKQDKLHKEIEKKMANMIKAIQQGLNIEILAPEMNKLNEEKMWFEIQT